MMVYWEREAAFQDHYVAQANLAYFYEHGKGVRKDMVRALMWTILVARQMPWVAGMGYSFAERRDELISKMTPAQIAEAQRLAREWKPKTE